MKTENEINKHAKLKTKYKTVFCFAKTCETGAKSGKHRPKQKTQAKKRFFQTENVFC